VNASEKQILIRLRPLCPALPGFEDCHIWSSNIPCREKTFAILRGPPGEPAIPFKVINCEQGIFLNDRRVFVLAVSP
jgi:hypothetical protein